MGKEHPKIKIPETAIQKSIVATLSALCRQYKFMYFAVLNEAAMLTGPENQHKVTTHLRSMGLTPGTSDLIIGCVGKIYCMEVKSSTGRPTTNQISFRAWCESCGIPYIVVRSISDVIKALKSWRIIK